MSDQRIQLEIYLENGQFKVATTESADAVKNLGAGIKKAEQDTKSGISGIAGGLQNLTSIVKGFVGLQIVQFFYNIGKSALKGAADLEKNKIAFETMLGTAGRATTLMKDIQNMAAATPFETPGLVNSAKQLLAFGVAQKDVIPTMTRLGDAAMGNQEIFDRLSLAYGKTAAKGRASMEEINMFIEAGVPLTAQLAKNMGVTTAQLSKMIENGQVGFSKVDQALTSLTTGTGQFAGMMEKQSKSLGGLFSTLADNIKIGLTSAATMAAEPIKELLAEFIDGADTAGLFGDAMRVIGFLIGAAVNEVLRFVNSVQLLKAKIGELYYSAKAWATNDTADKSKYEEEARVYRQQGYSASNKLQKRDDYYTNAIKNWGKDSESTVSEMKPGGAPTDSAGEAAKKASNEAKKAAQEYAQYSQMIVSSAQNMVSSLSSIYQMQAEMEQQRYENLRAMGDAFLDYQNNQIMAAAGFKEQTDAQKYAAEIADLQKQYAKTNNIQKKKDIQEQIQLKQDLKKKAELEEEAGKRKQAWDLTMDLWKYQMMVRQFKSNQQLQIANATVSMIGGAVAAFASAFTSIPNPIAAAIIGGAMSALVLGLGATQIGMIAQQQPPMMFETGGFFAGSPAGTAIVAEKNKAEAVIPFENETYMSRFREALGINNEPRTVVFQVQGNVYDERGFLKVLKHVTQTYNVKLT